MVIRGRSRISDKDCVWKLVTCTENVMHLLPWGSEEGEVFGVGSIPVAILSSCQDMKTMGL